jgi:glutaredoxin
MKRITMVSAQNCAYCKKAKNLLDRIYLKYPEYMRLDFETIEVEEADRRKLNFETIPAFFINDERVYEGYMTIDKFIQIMEAAYTDSTLPFAK